ncbi:right-handed parallel beta-helix repeat-containing protein [Sinorhizobium sp. BJ1]|uniref:right-handed parallel beta-helix repeat-containing protein n=1 Tax=Sinorhizobium sp. BJ1 TaxID=2035455 RepID=UPI001AECF7B6|nr:right-handed parallel beta-helix repeat-containing protein [Sinorhizobium sp. BJ1]
MATAATVFRDYETDGVPASGSHKVKKSDVRGLLTGYETIINAFTSNGGLVFTLRASLDAQLTYPVGTMAWVIGDPVVANNGVYQKIGASGTGTWNRVADLPFSFIIASDVGAGTANAIQATTSIPVSSSALIWMNVFEANTATPVTVSFNGGSALTVKTNSGNDVSVGGLTSGMIVLGIVSGSTFRLVSDQASSAILAAAEAAKAAAEAAQAAAEAAAASVNIKNVATRAALKALNTAVTTLAFLGEGGRNGIFKWTSGDFSTQIAADTQEGIYIKADAIASTAGAWVRQYDGLVNVKWYGAVGDGVTNDTAAFIAAGLLTGQEVIVPYASAGYFVQGTIPINCRLAGEGKPTIKLTTAGGVDANGDKGLWLKSGSSIKNFRIERTPTASAISGEFNNAIVVGEYATSGTSYANIEIDNVDLVGIEGGVGRRSIMGIYGNVRDSKFSNMRIVGLVSYGMMIHWGGNFDPALPDTGTVTQSWHPRRITIENVFMDSFDPDNGLGGLYLSGAHDITVSRVAVHDCRSPFTVAAGDVGGLVAQGESANSVCKNIRFENCAIKNYETVGLIIGGVSGTRAGSIWNAANEDVSVVIDGLTIERGPLSTAGRALDFRMFQNIDVRGLSVTHQSDMYSDIFTPAVFVQACNAVYVKGYTNVPFAHEVAGGTNVVIDTEDYCLRSDYDSNCIGTRLTGQSGAHTLGAAIALNDTTVTLTDLDFDVVAGSTITISGSTMTITRAAATSATSIVLSITPSLVAAASSTAATVEKATKNIDIKGFADRFQYGVYLINTNSGHAENVNISKRFFRSGLHDIYVRAARGVKIVNCAFYESGQTDVAACNNVRMIDASTDVSIEGCTFEDNESGATKARHNIYLFGDSVGCSIRGNAFFRASTSAINKFAPSTGTDIDHNIGDNWFGPLLAARISGTSGIATASMGDRKVGFGTAAPTTGSWSQGDIIWSKSAAASGKAGWICVTAGSPGTWKTFAAIDA